MSKLRSNEFINAAGNGAPSFPQGATTIEPTADSQVATKSYVDNALFSVLGQTAPSLVPPTNPKIGTFWVDTSFSPSLLKVWNGTLWLEFSGTSGGVVSTSAIATPEVLTPANFSGFPDFSFAPQSSQITSVTNIDADNVRLVMGDNTVSNNGSVIPGFTIDDMLSVGDDVYHSPSSQHHWIATLSSTLGDVAGEGVAYDSSGNVYVTGHFYDGSTTNILIAKYNPSGGLQWQRKLGGNNTDIANGIAVDTLNNVFIAGETRSGSASLRDFFVAKYDTDGNIQWQKRLKGAGSDFDAAKHIAVDNLGNAYAVGYVVDSRNSIFIVKYNTDGNLQWQHELTSSSLKTEQGLEIAVDVLGNAYISGYAEGDTSSYTETIIAKYDTDGNIQWQRKLYGTGGNDRGHGIAVDTSGNVYVGSENSRSDIGIVIAKYDTDGNIQWQRTLRGLNSGTDSPSALTADGAGNVYIAAKYYARTSSIYSGKNEYLIAKYDTNGNLQWYRMLYGRYNDVVAGIALDKFGNICIAGYSESVHSNMSQDEHRSFVTAKLPGDGTGTGVYGNFTYGLSTGSDPDLVSEVSTLTEAASTLVDSASSYSESVPTLDNTTYSLDSSIISVTGSSGTISEISGNTITLSDISGTWSTGMTVTSFALKTVSGGISTTVTFTSSAPVVASGLIASWGNAEWQIAEDSGFTTNVQTLTSPLNTTITPITHNITTSAQTGDYLLTGSDRSNTFTGDADPTITLFVGDTLTFNNAATYSSHPMFIRDADRGASVSNPAPTGEGTMIVSWTPTVAGTYYYQCAVHPAMIGTITVNDIVYPTQSGPSRGFTVNPNDPYYVRVRYDATDPAELTSQWSSSKYFKIVE